jgi:hypothetical protein
MTDPCEGKYDIVSRLRDHTNRDDNDIAEAAAYIERLRAERDEARRLYCIAFQEITENLGEKNTTESIAEEMGWDCFKKENTNG